MTETTSLAPISSQIWEMKYRYSGAGRRRQGPRRQHPGDLEQDSPGARGAGGPPL